MQHLPAGEPLRWSSRADALREAGHGEYLLPSCDGVEAVRSGCKKDKLCGSQSEIERRSTRSLVRKTVREDRVRDVASYYCKGTKTPCPPLGMVGLGKSLIASPFLVVDQTQSWVGDGDVERQQGLLRGRLSKPPVLICWFGITVPSWLTSPVCLPRQAFSLPRFLSQTGSGYRLGLQA